MSSLSSTRGAYWECSSAGGGVPCARSLASHLEDPGLSKVYLGALGLESLNLPLEVLSLLDAGSARLLHLANGGVRVVDVGLPSLLDE